MTERRPPTRVGLVGAGASGAEAAAHWLRTTDLVIELAEPSDRRIESVLAAAAPVDRSRIRAVEVITAPTVVLACPNRLQTDFARRFVASGRSVVSMADDPATVERLLELDPVAAAAGVAVVAGVGMSPGLSCLLAGYAARDLDEVDEVAVAKTGTGGPACARQHHRALKRPGMEWLEGAWVERSGGTGRDLLWFPGDLGARDAYRADLPEPLLLQRRFPTAARLSARMTATRRDRFTSFLPMLRPPHDDGGPGGVRVEVRGRRSGRYETVVVGAAAHPSLASGVLAAAVAHSIVQRHVAPGAHGVGGHGVGEHLGDWLRECVRAGVQVARFDGHHDGSVR